MKTRLLLLTVLIGITLSACSVDSGDKIDNNIDNNISKNSDNKKSTLTGEHVWKSQTDALKHAQQVAKQANDMIEKQRKAMEKLNNEKLNNEQ